MDLWSVARRDGRRRPRDARSFGDVTATGTGSRSCTSSRACSPTRVASTRSGSASTTAPTSPSQPRGARGHRHPHRADRARLRRHGALERRPDPDLPALLHRRRALRAVGPRSPSGAARSSSFPLFGYDLADYEALFAESSTCSPPCSTSSRCWSGRTRAPLDGQRVCCSPGTASRPGSAWAAAQSVGPRRALRLPLVIAIIGGPAERFAPFADLYRRALEEVGRELPDRRALPGHIADTDEQALEQAWPHYRPCTTGSAASAAGAHEPKRVRRPDRPSGALYVGSPETVAQDRGHGAPARAHPLRPQVLDGHAAHDQMMRTIRLYGTQVDPDGARPAQRGLVSERLDELLRWESSGGHWEVASDDGDVVRLALRTCLGDEVVGELVSDDPTCAPPGGSRPRRRRYPSARGARGSGAP